MSWVFPTGIDAREQMEDCDSHLYTPGTPAATVSPRVLASPLKLWRLAPLPVLVQPSLMPLILFYLTKLQTSSSPIFSVFFMPAWDSLLSHLCGTLTEPSLRHPLWKEVTAFLKCAVIAFL